MIRVCVSGATGWVGIPLCKAIAATNDLQLVGAVARRSRGLNLKDLATDPALDLPISATVDEALGRAPADVLVDFTSAEAVKVNVLAAIARRVHVVIGSSGLSEADFAEIAAAAQAQRVGVLAAGNFAISAVLLERFACQAARYLPAWEIIDFASDAKIDAPSGTARELAYRLSEVGRPQVTHPIEKTVGPIESRGVTLNGSQVHSIRLPGYVIGVEVQLGAPGERLTLRHDAGSGAGPYIQGALLAIRKVGGLVGLIRGLDRIME